MANPAFVQNVSGVSASGASVISAAALTPTAGNFLIALNASPTGTWVPTVTDNVGNTWSQIGVKYTARGSDLYAFYAIANSSTPTTVTYTCSAAPGGQIDVIVAEYSALSQSLDGDAGSVSATNVTTITGASVTTTNAIDVLICHYCLFGSSNPTLPSTGWTIRVTDSIHNGFADNRPTVTGTYQFSATIGSEPYATRTIAFKGGSLPILPHPVASSSSNVSPVARSVRRPLVSRF